MKSWEGYIFQVMEVFRTVSAMLLLVFVTYYVLTPEVSCGLLT